MKPGDGGTHSKKKKRVVADPKGKAEFKPAKKALKRRAVVVAEVKDTKGADLARGKRAAEPVIREQRVKYLRRTGQTSRGDVRRPIVRELEGRGVVAKALRDLGEGKSRALKNSDLGRAIALSNSPKVKGTVVGRAAKDVVNFPAQAIPSVYVPVAAVVEAAKGDTKRIKKLAKDIDEQDPFYNLGAAAVEAAGGDTKSAGKRLKKAKHLADEHPGFTLIEGAGVKGTVGRGAGKVMRSGAAGKKAKQLASTEGKPRVLEGTKLVESRTYSKDVLSKAVQVNREGMKRTQAQTLRRKADIEERKGNRERAEELRHRAAKKDPDRMSEAEIRRRVDERQAANEDIRRINRAEVTEKARKVLKTAGADEKALPLVAQRITKADPDDLRAYRDELAAEYAGLSNAGKRANKQVREAIDRVLDDPEADLSRVDQAAREYRELIEPLQAKLTDRQLLAKDQVDKAKLVPYAVRRMGAKHDGKELVDGNGVPVTAQMIRAHMAKNGVEEPAFITQAPNQRGARNFFVSSSQPQRASAGKRTGEATRKGTFDVDPETLVEGAAKAQGLVDATDGFRGFVDEFAHRSRETKNVTTYPSYSRAKEKANELMFDNDGDPIPGAVKWRPVRLNPWGAAKEQLQDLLERVDADDQVGHRAIVEQVEKALTDTSGDGPWALVPEVAADQLAQHMRTLGGDASAKTWQAINQAFRSTVLATSPSWMTGNVMEGAFRTGIAGAGPRSYVHGRRVLRKVAEMDPEAGKAAAVRTVGGGQFKQAAQTIRRSADQFDDTKLEGMARALSAVWRASGPGKVPGPREVANVWRWYTDVVFNKVNGSIESSFQTAMLGKALRDAGLKAVDEAADGLRGTNAQVRFGREVDLMYGKYRKFSPQMRRNLVLYTPFAAWAVNAAYFVMRTLPAKHPTTLAVIASAEQVTEEWRKEHGLDLFVAGRRPGFLQGAIPLAGGGSQRAPSRYLPFAFFADPLHNAGSAVLPQFSGVLAAFEGEDWKGAKLRGPDGEPANEIQKALFAAKAFLEATVPVLNRGQQVAGKGPGSLNPLKPVEPKKKSSGGTKLRRKDGFDFGGSSEGFDFSGGGDAGFDFGG